MATKKKAEKGPQGEPSSGSGDQTQSVTLGTTKWKATPAAASLLQSSKFPSISRNKHWRHISTFPGSWLDMNIESLEDIAHANYNAPRPHPFDVALGFNVVKIRRLVDEAVNLAVRAANDIATPKLTSVNGSMSTMQAGAAELGIDLNPSRGGKLSRERKFRMREQASQKLARAYRLDEVVCSVLSMQSTSLLEDIGSWVLHRNPQDRDAKYVHFFHQRIPSRQLAEFTSVTPLTEIWLDMPHEIEVLRTRAMVKAMTFDFEGSIEDFSTALISCRTRQRGHSGVDENALIHVPPRSRRRAPGVILAECEQPDGLESQLMYFRGDSYLALACKLVLTDDWKSPEQTEDVASESQPADSTANGNSPKLTTNGNSPKAADGETKPDPLEVRKSIKLFAKRALRDYMGFLSTIDYSPNYPVPLILKYEDQFRAIANNTRLQRSNESYESYEPHTTYSLDRLFAAIAPSDLPPFKPVVPYDVDRPPMSGKTSEYLTYHPLLQDALHSLLLCHLLIQTSPTELRRHAYMVARLVRIFNAGPLFQRSTSTARSDWADIILKADNWLQLEAPWEDLVQAIPVLLVDSEHDRNEILAYQKALSTTANSSPLPPLSSRLANNFSAYDFLRMYTKDKAFKEAIMTAMVDEEVYDEESLNAAVRKNQQRISKQKALFPQGASSTPKVPMIELKPPTTESGTPTTESKKLKTEKAKQRTYDDDLRDPQDWTRRRTTAMADWVLEAPVVPALTKRKKKPRKGKAPLSEGLGRLELGQ